jgi:hypothetical protein
MAKGRPRIHIKCKNCGVPTPSKNKYRPFCSKECKIEGTYPMLTCAICGSSFRAKFHNAKYCKKDCYLEGQRRKSINNYTPESRAHFSIFRRDSFKCVYCGISAHDGAKLVVDHIYPLRRGGGNDPFNLVTACQSCNSSKSYSLLTQSQTLTLWGRNLELDIKYGIYPSYEELKAVFDKLWGYRMIDPLKPQ